MSSLGSKFTCGACDRRIVIIKGDPGMATAELRAGGAASPIMGIRWVDAETAGMTPEQLLLHRSNLLGADKRVTNFRGGNTSAKIGKHPGSVNRAECRCPVG